MDTDLVPEQQVIGAASLDPTPAWYGPGENYAHCGSDVQSGVDGVEIYGRENGFVQVDFYDAGRKCRRRIWVPESALSDIVWY